VVSDKIVALPTVDIPGLSNVPVLKAFDHQSPLMWAGFALVPLVAVIIFRTGLGLRIRAVGEAPDSALASGVPADRMRYAAFAASGVLCGVAGTQLSLGFLALFSQDMTSGVGYIAFAAVVFGGASPVLVFLGALVFGFSQAAVIELGKSLEIPSQFISMFPYFVAIAALVVLSQRRASRRTAVSTV
jgi:simple sugar transport system permease protein